MDNSNIPTIDPSLYSNSNEKISPTILSLTIILLILQLIAVIFPFIVQKRNIKKQENIKPSLRFYLTCSIIELGIIITLIVFNRTSTSLNINEIKLIFYSILSYIVLQTINLFSNVRHDLNQKLENYNESRNLNNRIGGTHNNIDYNHHMNNHKEGFNLFTSIYIIRMVGTFLSVHIFSRILFHNKFDLENNTLKIILDILIPFSILFLFRFIERLVFFKKSKEPIDKKFWKQLFLGNWNHNKIKIHQYTPMKGNKNSNKQSNKKIKSENGQYEPIHNYSLHTRRKQTNSYSNNNVKLNNNSSNQQFS